MKFKPHEYQRFAVDFIKTHEQAAVLLDMGLGKTVITLTALNDLLFDSFDVHKVLVIAPLRVTITWRNEMEKWEHLSGLTFSVVTGTPKKRNEALKAKADIYIVNRENVDWLIEKSGIPFDFDTVVVDELSSFKSHKAKRHKALMKVRPKVERIIGLTGTPSSNGLLDLFAQYKLLDMGERLGRFISQYRSFYFNYTKIVNGIPVDYVPLPGAEDAIYQKISDITISMKADDYLQMPELIINDYKVQLSSSEIKRYKVLEKDMVLSLGEDEITAGGAAVLAGKLCQIANGAIYNEDGDYIGVHDRKLDALEDIIEAANGKPLLVAYWFKHDKERIKKRLTDKKISFSEIDTVESIEKWNRGETPVALIHPASAGHGLNLQDGGNNIVWFGMTWSLELYQQLNGRLYRQGQKDKCVVITHIIAENTIDERIVKVLKDKDSTQSKLIEAVKAEVT